MESEQLCREKVKDIESKLGTEQKTFCRSESLPASLRTTAQEYFLINNIYDSRLNSPMLRQLPPMWPPVNSY